MTGFMEAMGTSSIPFVAAFFIGLMTALSPCPLATNITAIAYISKKLDEERKTLIVGLCYAAGRALTYILIAATIVYLGLEILPVSSFLRTWGEVLLGPFLLLIGFFILEYFSFNIPGRDFFKNLKFSAGEMGLFGSFILGVILAFGFCPFSAALFFGMLIPLALKSGDAIFIPAVFAFATALPVIIISILLTGGILRAARFLERMQAANTYMKRAVGYVFLMSGAYFTSSWIYGMYIGYF